MASESWFNPALTTRQPPGKSDDHAGVVNSLRPYSQSKFSAVLFSAFLAASSAIPPTFLNSNAYIPPFIHRAGFSIIFAGSAYVISSGDTRNGSGITTAWSLAYLFLNLRKSVRPPVHPLSLALTGSAAACATLYGTEYFWFQR